MLSGPKPAPEPVAKTDASGKKLTKSQRKKLKKKRRKENKKSENDSGVETGNDSDQNQKKGGKNLQIDIDYIAEEPELNPATLQFKKVFDAFRAAELMASEERVPRPG